MKKLNMKKTLDVVLSVTTLAIAFIVVVSAAIGTVATILGLMDDVVMNGFFAVIVVIAIVFEFKFANTNMLVEQAIILIASAVVTVLVLNYVGSMAVNISLGIYWAALLTNVVVMNVYKRMY